MRTLVTLFVLLLPGILGSPAEARTLVLETVVTGPWSHLYGDPGETVRRDLVVQLKDKESGTPVAGIPVHFSTLLSPGKGGAVALSSETVTTGNDGKAHTSATLGKEAGDYLVGARVDVASFTPQERAQTVVEDSTAQFPLTARKKGWPFFLAMELVAGLALFMFGIRELSVGMRTAAGSRLRRAMQVMTHNRFLALCVGIFITVLFQSSCATTVMLVSFVQAGLLRAVETLAIILGADIGTTMTVQLFAFKITDYTLIAVAVGFFMQAYAKRPMVRAAGQSVLGLGLLFTGMNFMSQSTYPLRSYEPFVEALMGLHSVIPAILAGAVATALIRSSAAFIGIVMVFASQGLVTLDQGIALCLGANLGTCVTAALASINASHEAKRVAFAHMMFKVLGIALLVTWIPTFAGIVRSLSGEASSIERQIANAHTLFNVGLAFLFLPFLGLFNRLIKWALPTPARGGAMSAVVLDTGLLNAPPLALSAAKQEIIRMGREAQQMVRMSLESTLEGEPTVDKEALLAMERAIDGRYESIRSFLALLMERRLPEEQVWETLLALRTLHDIEQMADIVEDRIIPRIEILRENSIMLSEEGRRDLQEYHTKVLKQISRSLDLFNSMDRSKASHISERFERYCLLACELKNTHFQRLGNHVPESEQTSNVHLNLISALLDISNLATNIARHMKERSLSDERCQRPAAEPLERRPLSFQPG